MSYQANRMWCVFVLFFCFSVSIHAQNNTALTVSDSVKQMARVSVDGLSVVFVGDKEADNECKALNAQDQEIFLFDADTGEIKRLTTNEAEDTNPSISGDGQLITFSRAMEGGRFAVYVFDMRTNEELRISAKIQSGSSTISAIRSMISADGSTVVYEQNGDIFVTPADGSTAPSNLTRSPDVADQFPTISGDGTQIAFESNGDYLGTNPGGDVEIFAISALSTSLRQLTRNEVPDHHPWISGNGGFVAFERELAGPQFDVIVVPADGSLLESNLTLSADKDEHFPSLNQSGDVVAFEVVQENRARYAKMNRDGTGLVALTQITSAPTDHNNVTLTDDGQRAAFTAEDKDSDCRQLFISGPVPNRAPLANGGGDRMVAVGDTVQLDASGSSDADDDPLSFAWKIVSKPEGSQAVLDNPGSAKATFVADIAGAYLIGLTVADGRDGIDSDKVNIVAEGNGDSTESTTVEQALDLNDNFIIDDDEVITAISFWVLGTPVEGTELVIGDDQIIGLIELWILGAPFEAA